MYELLVYYASERTPHVIIKLAAATEVLQRISTLLAEHHGCEHIVVMMGQVRLFSVDCAGNRLP